MNIKNKPTITVGLIGILLLGFITYALQFPLTGLKRKLFFKACSFSSCGTFHEQLEVFNKKFIFKNKSDLNELAKAELFIDFYFISKKKEPLNYVIALRQYNRLVTKYKNLIPSPQNLSSFKEDYNKFHHCHKNLVAYYQKDKEKYQVDLRKLDLQLFSSSTEKSYSNFHKNFMNTPNLVLPDLSPFQSSVLIVDRCLQKIDDALNIQKFIATKGQTVNLRSIQKDIIQFEARFDTKYRKRYEHLIHLDTKQYLDQTLSL
jgi:hypothetical protein